MAHLDDWLEPQEHELTVNLPEGWDGADVAALLRRAADEIDALGAVHIERLRLDWSHQAGDRVATVALAYRRQRRPPDVPAHAAPMDLPIRDSAGRIVGHRSRPGGGISSDSGT